MGKAGGKREFWVARFAAIAWLLLFLVTCIVLQPSILGMGILALSQVGGWAFGVAIES